jgi:deoxyribodipyrimidine photo-lyase
MAEVEKPPLAPGWVERGNWSRFRRPLPFQAPRRAAPAKATPSEKSKQPVNVVWFKSTDLRTHDHASLDAASKAGLPVVALFVFDPFWFGTTRDFGFPKTGAHRAKFLLESVDDLRSRLAGMGVDLAIRHGDTEKVFAELVEDFAVQSVFAYHELCAEEQRIASQVRRVVESRGGSLRLAWGFELYHMDDVPASAGRSKSYTGFRKTVEERRVRACLPTPKRLPGLRWRSDTVSLATLGLQEPAAEPRAELRWTGGETAALQRVADYLWDTDALSLRYVGATMTMDEAKSCLQDRAMFKISPWLAHGCISPRFLYHEIRSYEKERRKSKSTGWIVHELIWRDFVRFGARATGTKMFKIGGLDNVNPRWSWSRDAARFEAWQKGNTGIPLIDAFMRELDATGYTCHMGRETSGWFLVGDLGIDWRLGAEWFESVLIDYEPTANWFNWVYRCLPAIQKPTPPMIRLQTGEVLRWGAQHDPDAAYIKRWIPELAKLPPTMAREPWRILLSQAQNDPQSTQRAGPTSAQPSTKPKERFSVSRKDLNQVMELGFSELDAALALKGQNVQTAIASLLAANPQICGGCQYLKAVGKAAADGGWYCEDCWDGWEDDAGDDPELQAAIAASTAGDDPELQAAIALSLGQAPEPPAPERPAPAAAAAPAFGDFVYGRDYPEPLLEPVCLRGSEEVADSARAQQQKRELLIAQQETASKKHRKADTNAARLAKLQRDDQKGTGARPPAEVVDLSAGPAVPAEVDLTKATRFEPSKRKNRWKKTGEENGDAASAA